MSEPRVDRLTPEQRRKFYALGGLKWLRTTLDHVRAPEPIADRPLTAVSTAERVKILEDATTFGVKRAAAKHHVSVHTIYYLRRKLNAL